MTLEEQILGTNTKNELVAKLEEKYGKNYFGHPDIVNEPLFHGTNDTKITRALYEKLYFSSLREYADIAGQVNTVSYQRHPFSSRETE